MIIHGKGGWWKKDEAMPHGFLQLGVRCTDDAHWWARTPPRPYDPHGYTADEAKCQCWHFRYDQRKGLLQATPSIKVGTFVPEAYRTGVYVQCPWCGR